MGPNKSLIKVIIIIIIYLQWTTNKILINKHGLSLPLVVSLLLSLWPWWCCPTVTVVVWWWKCRPWWWCVGVVLRLLPFVVVVLVLWPPLLRWLGVVIPLAATIVTICGGGGGGSNAGSAPAAKVVMVPPTDIVPIVVGGAPSPTHCPCHPCCHGGVPVDMTVVPISIWSEQPHYKHHSIKLKCEERVTCLLQ